jgi:hypothetical protein
MGNQRLTAWAMARPDYILFLNKIERNVILEIGLLTKWKDLIRSSWYVEDMSFINLLLRPSQHNDLMKLHKFKYYLLYVSAFHEAIISKYT